MVDILCEYICYCCGSNIDFAAYQKKKKMKSEIVRVIFEIIALLSLSIPLIWELRDDRIKDLTHDRDVFIRWALAAAVAFIVWVSGKHSYIDQHGFFQAAFLSLSLHFLIFDYGEAAQLKHKNWFEYLGKSSKQDQTKWWIHIGAKWRFVIRLVIFSIAIILYF